MEIPYIDYDRHVTDLVSIGIPMGNVFRNWSDDEAEQLQSKFDFYQGYLKAGYKFSKELSYFYFSEDYGLGGGAKKIGQYYFAKIYIGTFNRFHTLHGTNTTLFDAEGLDRIKGVNQHTAFPINELMRDICLHFTYYHEVAHLHQDSRFLVGELTEDHIQEGFDFERHLLEYDADIFSALSVCTHIFEYFDNFHQRKAIKDLEEITSILLAAILIRILLSPGMKMQFYTKETTHPHWIIRMLQIIDTITNHLNNIVASKYNLTALNISILRRKAFAYTNILNQTLDLNINLGDISQMMVKNQNVIEAYSTELLAGINSYPTSALNKWNS